MWEIIRKNRETYYSYDTGKKLPVVRRYALVLLAAIVVGIVLQSPSTDFLQAVLTVLSILVGFSFSVLFFLLSAPTKESGESGSLELDVKQEKVTRLTNEIFHNVSYFNVVTLACVVVALLLMLPAVTDWPALRSWTISVSDKPLSLEELCQMASSAIRMLQDFARIAFYSLLFESMCSFVRTVQRVTYLFEQRLKLTQV